MIRDRCFRLGAGLFVLLCLISGCKKDPITATLPPDQETIAVVCSPSTASPGEVVKAAVAIASNSKEVRVFGLEATFDPQMFEFQGAEKGSLNPSWVIVDGNEVSPGNLKIGGYACGGSAVPKNSNGTLVVIKLKVTGASYGNGAQSRIAISHYTDDLAGFQPESASTLFTLKKSGL